MDGFYTPWFLLSVQLLPVALLSIRQQGLYCQDKQDVMTKVSYSIINIDIAGHHRKLENRIYSQLQFSKSKQL